jgi:triosephosphate isomerase
VIAPPALYLLLTQQLLRKDIKVAAQNIFDKGPGAYTGEIVPQQLKDAGIEWVLLGHSERRAIFGESDEFVASKTRAAIEAGLNVILCCGESLEEREKGITTQVVTRQLGAVAKAIKPEDWKNVVVAYEPVWAIGTGKVATTEVCVPEVMGLLGNGADRGYSKRRRPTRRLGSGWERRFRRRSRTRLGSFMVDRSPRRTPRSSPSSRMWMDSWLVVPA